MSRVAAVVGRTLVLRGGAFSCWPLSSSSRGRFALLKGLASGCVRIVAIDLVVSVAVFVVEVVVVVVVVVVVEADAAVVAAAVMCVAMVSKRARGQAKSRRIG